MTSDLHPVRLLLTRLAAANLPYPEGTVSVGYGNRPPIEGTGFFPGAYGLWRPDASEPLSESPRPIGGIMFVGNNFGSQKYYQQRRRLGNEVSLGNRVAGSPTWTNLLPLIDQVEIPKTACFFTNAYMGLLEGDKSNLSDFPRGDGTFGHACQDFMRQQIAVMTPRVIVALGLPALQFLGVLGNFKPWREAKKWAALDTTGNSIARLHLDAEPIWALALLHPSYRRPNLSKRPRWYEGKAHPNAEALLLRDVTQRAGIALGSD